MRSLSGACALLLLMACGTTEDRSGLVRRPLSQASQGGWVRLPLDGEAQAQMPSLWVGDAKGRSVPFLVEREGLWEPRRLDLERVLLGRDSQGRPTAEFALKFPEGWQVREREQLRIELELEGSGSWVCPVKVERRGRGWSHHPGPGSPPPGLSPGGGRGAGGHLHPLGCQQLSHHPPGSLREGPQGPGGEGHGPDGA